MKKAIDIQRAARAILGGAAMRRPQYAKALQAMKLRVSSRMTACAGKASYRKNEISLSLPFFADENNFQEHLENTVTHEAAHLLVGVFGRVGKPHGSQWQMVHRTLGGTASRTHDMSLAEGYSKRQAALGVESLCSKCGQPIQLGPVQAKRQQSGRARYRHKNC